MKRKPSKLQIGTLWRHKKYPFTIKIISKNRHRYIFDVTEGNLHDSLKPDVHYDYDYDDKYNTEYRIAAYYYYSRDSILNNFDLISNYKAAYLLQVESK